MVLKKILEMHFHVYTHLPINHTIIGRFWLDVRTIGKIMSIICNLKS